MSAHISSPFSCVVFLYFPVLVLTVICCLGFRMANIKHDMDKDATCEWGEERAQELAARLLLLKQVVVKTP